MRQAANLGLRIFPVSLLAKLKGTPDLFIGAATSDISSLEKLAAAAYPVHECRVALGPSSLCALQFDGETARKSFAALVPDLDEWFTLQARRGDITGAAFFRWLEGLVLRALVRATATSFRPLAAMSGQIFDGDRSGPLPVARTCVRSAGQYSGTSDVRSKAFAPPGPVPAHRALSAAQAGPAERLSGLRTGGLALRISHLPPPVVGLTSLNSITMGRQPSAFDIAGMPASSGWHVREVHIEVHLRKDSQDEQPRPRGGNCSSSNLFAFSTRQKA